MPLFSPALARQLRELPNVADGLSFSQRLVLRILADYGELPAVKVLGHPMSRYEPLQYLGDLTFNALARPLMQHTPLVHWEPASEWQHGLIRLSSLGERALLEQVNWLDYDPP